MYDFKADVVYHLGGVLKGAVALFKEPISWYMENPSYPIDPELIQKSMETTRNSFEKDKVEHNIDLLGLVHSKKAYSRAISTLRESPTKFVLIRVHSALDGLDKTFESEIEEHKFLWLLSDEADKYGDRDPFHIASHPVLGKVWQDSLSASRCLALGQQTACVFHLGRILEYASQQIGKKVGVQPTHNKMPVPIEETNWDKILTLIDNQIEELRKNPTTATVSPVIKEDPDLYKSLVNQFRIMKDVWRNPVAHPHLFIGTNANNPKEGWKIFESVRLFIDKLNPLLL